MIPETLKLVLTKFFDVCFVQSISQYLTQLHYWEIDIGITLLNLMSLSPWCVLLISYVDYSHKSGEFPGTLCPLSFVSTHDSHAISNELWGIPLIDAPNAFHFKRDLDLQEYFISLSQDQIT